jgi:hypothetical protein
MIAALDPIRPYLWPAKWVGLAVVVSVLFVGGCRHGERRQAREDAKAIKAAQGEAAGYKAQVGILSQRLAEIDAETAETARLAAERVRAAEEAAKRAVKAEAALRAEMGEIERDIAKAKRDPDCRRMMEARVCALLQ